MVPTEQSLLQTAQNEELKRAAEVVATSLAVRYFKVYMVWLHVHVQLCAMMLQRIIHLLIGTLIFYNRQVQQVG